MNNPKRYAWKVNEENDFDLIEHPHGEFIRYDDYARLKAEVERLTRTANWILLQWDANPNGEWQKALNQLFAKKADEVARLKAEVERLNVQNKKIMYTANKIDANNQRLIKAGDAMEDAIIDGGLNRMNKARDDWNDAKDGKQS